MALAGRIGVGSLAGVALSIYIGGIGSIFWMWVTAFLCAPNAFSEGLLGVLYHKKGEDGVHYGGPSHYIRNGLKKKNWANVYAVLIIFAYIFGYLSIQSNTITNSITNVINIKPIVIGIIITFITSLVIFKGDKGIIAAASKLVPVMSVIYVGVTLFILIINIFCNINPFYIVGCFFE